MIDQLLVMVIVFFIIRIRKIYGKSNEKEVYYNCKRRELNMEKIKVILESPLYTLLFGGGGILIIFISILSMRKKRDEEEEKGININIDIDNRSGSENKTEYNLNFETRPTIDKREEYQSLDFKQEDYYVNFLKTVEEKKKEGDQFEYM